VLTIWSHHRQCTHEAGGATLGIAIQALVLVLAWRQAGIRFRPDFRWRDAGLGRFGKLAAWTFGAMLVAQVGGIVESRVVSIASGEDASLATVALASLIAVLPYSLITMSIAVPYFTRLSTHARDGDVKAAMAEYQADGVSEEYAALERQWNSAGTQVRAVITAIRNSLQENDEVARRALAMAKAAIPG